MYCAARPGGVAKADTCGGTPAAGYNPAEGTSRRRTRPRRSYITVSKERSYAQRAERATRVVSRRESMGLLRCACVVGAL